MTSPGACDHCRRPWLPVEDRGVVRGYRLCGSCMDRLRRLIRMWTGAPMEDLGRLMCLAPRELEAQILTWLRGPP